MVRSVWCVSRGDHWWELRAPYCLYEQTETCARSPRRAAAA